jgi:regulator of protease activity HflC (stomatin/prohibitin superfamily)
MKEITIKAYSGFLFVLVEILIVTAIVYLFVSGIGVRTQLYPILLILSFIFILIGFMIIYPNQSMVLTLFGKYVGTVKENGFKWTNPFYFRKKISLRARNFDSERVKVNDKRGNPILISVILVWRVHETYRAAFEVDNYESFVRVQTDAAVRKLSGMYSYDNFDDDQRELTLRSNVGEINDALERELGERLDMAGIEVIEARIGYLAYAPEIAGAMLKRQQAEAVVAARLKIVEGAVSMVENPLEDLSKKEIIHLDEDKRASMVSNLMVVLCSDREVTPVINTGTLLP